MGPLESAEKHSEPATMVDLFREKAVKAIKEDEAEVIIPGCTIVSTLLTSQKVFAIDEVPIIDPVYAGIKMAEVMVDLKKKRGTGVCRAGIYAAATDWEKVKQIGF
jgi:Asp/Glu/hydantoin racemase